ncbi:hypothetical protein [Streptomonospora litoralis]|uniref:Uncharacterized protein n=1 Tax=Streptomonospora litoralis TaxID=2498135 RepID=A0A4P6PX80_9ACTN|nr:hypothetical protein [Streptomonospora litoralis]QBI52725.1 hypothetical protein EKD16_04590 [Streptomonospora litoralis]
MNNEALNRLRVPAAWALLGAVAAHMLGGLIFIFGHGATYDASIAGNFTSVGGSLFYGPLLIGMLVGAVALVVTAPTKTSVNFPVVLVALILGGFAGLMGVIGLVMGFISANESQETADGFTSFLSVGGKLAVIVFALLFMQRVFGDHTLVPRSSPQQSMPMGMPGYAPQTGAQQSFAQPGYPTGGQPAYQPQQQDWSAQPAYGAAAAQPGGYDPNMYPGYDPNQPAAYDPAQQPYGADPMVQQGYAAQEPVAQSPYAADPVQQPYGADPNAQPAYGAASGGQQPYAQGWGQDPYAQPGAGQEGYQAAYGQAGYGQDWQQQGYGQGYQPGYDPYAQHAYGTGAGGQQPYGTGGQSAYGTGGQQPYASGGQQAYGTGTGGQPAYGSGADSSYGTGGQPAYGQQAYGTGGQPAYGSGGQPAYGSPYDPSQYAPQPGSESERAAQDAIQYGWYQQPGEQSEAPAAQQRRDTPLDSFFTDDSGGTDQTTRLDPYGQQSGEGGDTPQGWYRDDDRR